MSLQSYTDLQSALADWLNRADLSVRIPDFITLAESWLNRKLACREMGGLITLNVATDRAPLPIDFQAIESLSDAHGKFQYVSPQLLDERDWCYWDGSVLFEPRRFYSIVGRELIFPHIFTLPPGQTTMVPPGACMAKMRYRKRLCPLSTSNPCNWLLEKYPDAYLYGALLQSAPFLKDDDRVAMWNAAFTQIIDDIQDMDLRTVADTLEMQSDAMGGNGRYRYVEMIR